MSSRRERDGSAKDERMKRKGEELERKDGLDDKKLKAMHDNAIPGQSEHQRILKKRNYVDFTTESTLEFIPYRPSRFFDYITDIGYLRGLHPMQREHMRIFGHIIGAFDDKDYGSPGDFFDPKKRYYVMSYSEFKRIYFKRRPNHNEETHFLLTVNESGMLELIDNSDVCHRPVADDPDYLEPISISRSSAIFVVPKTGDRFILITTVKGRKLFMAVDKSTNIAHLKQEIFQKYLFPIEMQQIRTTRSEEVLDDIVTLVDTHASEKAIFEFRMSLDLPKERIPVYFLDVLNGKIVLIVVNLNNVVRGVMPELQKQFDFDTSSFEVAFQKGPKCGGQEALLDQTFFENEIHAEDMIYVYKSNKFIDISLTINGLKPKTFRVSEISTVGHLKDAVLQHFRENNYFSVGQQPVGTEDFAASFYVFQQDYKSMDSDDEMKDVHSENVLSNLVGTAKFPRQMEAFRENSRLVNEDFVKACNPCLRVVVDAPVRIYVSLLSGESKTFELRTSEPFDRLYSQIAEWMYVPQNDVRIFGDNMIKGRKQPFGPERYLTDMKMQDGRQFNAIEVSGRKDATYLWGHPFQFHKSHGNLPLPPGFLLLNVKDVNGKEISLVVDKSENIAQVKLRLRDRGIDCWRLATNIAKTEILDQHAVSHYFFKNGEELLSIPPLGDANRRQIFVKNLNGKMITININLSALVISLKWLLFDKENIRPGEQQLLFSGKHLQDYETLTECGVEKECTVMLFLPLCGS